MKTKFVTAFASFLLVVVLSCTSVPVLAQCAMCKSSVTSSRNNDKKLERFGNGLNRGILYIMSIPYILVGTVGFFWYRHSRKTSGK